MWPWRGRNLIHSSGANGSRQVAPASIKVSASNAAARRTSITSGDAALPCDESNEEIEIEFGIAVSMGVLLIEGCQTWTGHRLGVMGVNRIAQREPAFPKLNFTRVDSEISNCQVLTPPRRTTRERLQRLNFCIICSGRTHDCVPACLEVGRQIPIYSNGKM